MPYKPYVITKSYYSIGEVAEMFEVSTSLIRFWETEFDIIQPKKNRKGDRLFTQKDIENIKLIYHLVKEQGYTLKGAKEHLKTNVGKAQNDNSTKDLLLKLRAFLVELSEKL